MISHSDASNPSVSPQASDDEALRNDVRLLGNLLGDTIRKQHGQALFDLVEEVRNLSKQARGGESSATRELVERMNGLDSRELLDLARAYTLFLNLANIAEQHHQIRLRRAKLRARTTDDVPAAATPGYLETELEKLRTTGVSPDVLHDQACRLRIELVLTAHPTEILRRSISSKYQRIAGLLAQRDRTDLTGLERMQARQALHRAITEVWETDTIRRHRPTPVDEARSGLVTVEHSLWDVVPRVTRELDHALERTTGKRLPLDAVPLQFGSWMGGDRDGNPNTTPEVTARVCLLSRLKAAQLFLREIDELRRELSMHRCSETFREALKDDAAEPYRHLLQQVIRKLRRTIKTCNGMLERLPGTTAGMLQGATAGKIYQHGADLKRPLMQCYDSLLACGDETIAEGRLTDILRRLDTFGLTLLKLDIRQEAGRHTDALDAITRHLNMGSYAGWDEAERQQFLIRELGSNRPLITSSFPDNNQAGEEVREVLNTFRMIAAENPESFGAYVISMASQPSDVLAVSLLQKECRVKTPLRVVPLFERVDALRGAATCMDRLFSIDAYRSRIGNHQEVMIGYSDSAKDAGMLAAAWGLYQAQEEMVEVFQKHGIELTLFHGRGGTVARGGGPARQAIRSQPPGSVNGSMRVTEQGEVIQAKYGLPGMAEETLQVYISAILESGLAPPPAPEPHWRESMNGLASASLREFQGIVRHDPLFSEYFHQSTPLRELAQLKIGSRPASRRQGAGIEHLRAIPWIFAWTQTRLMLPAWLGVGVALESAINAGRLDDLKQMQKKWPFFEATLDSIEMVFAKADANLSSLYDIRLVEERLRVLGDSLRQRYHDTRLLLLDVTGHEIPLQDEVVVRRSIDVRNTYVIPLNLLQVELLSRARTGDSADVGDALLITVNGIAAGMRNTG